MCLKKSVLFKNFKWKGLFEFNVKPKEEFGNIFQN